MVMPRSRSRSIESCTCACISRASRPPHSWMKRSAKVDLPWSTCAMIEKLRIFFIKTRDWTNRRLYRSTVVCERFEHLFGVQPPVTDELPGEQQHGNLM